MAEDAARAGAGARWVVFTDLDGTLLDHDSYRWDPAAPALAALEAAAVPVVIVTSKTAAEVRALRAALGNHHPFVVENGAATVIPPGYFAAGGDEALVTAGAPRAAILETLAELRDNRGYRFAGFHDLGVAGIMEHTGLDEAAARAAADRAGSEPLLWQDRPERLGEFLAALAARGLRTVQGGRFLHVMGANDKAAAVRALLERYRGLWPGREVRSVALGDGPNDLGMLATADLAVVIRGRHAHAMPLPEGRRVVRTTQAGPEGWREAMEALLPMLTGQGRAAAARDPARQ